MTVNEIRKMQFTGASQEAVTLLLKELDLARASAIGYGATCIQEGICFPEECEDILGWKREAEEAGILDTADIPAAEDDDSEE